MNNSTIIPKIITEPNSSYVISYDQMVESKTTQEKYMNENEILRGLMKYFTETTEYLKKKRLEIG